MQRRRDWFGHHAIRLVFHASLVPGILSILLPIGPAPIGFASAQTSPQTAQPPEYVSAPMGQDIKQRIDKGLSDYRSNLSKIEKDLKKFKQENFKKDSYSLSFKGNQVTYDEMPKRHPLLDSNGVADTSQSDYTQKDTEVMFNPETFGECFEERQVQNGPYESECADRCPQGWVTWTGEENGSCLPCDVPPIPFKPVVQCKFNQHYVSEYYWPVYESRTYPGRAMGSFDPNGGYLSGEDKSPELAYDQARNSAYSRGRTNFKAAMQDYYNKNISDRDFGEALPQELWNAGDYTGRDVGMNDFDQTETQALHTTVYMTNANRQLSRRYRPGAGDYWKGYMEEDKCFFSALPDPKKLAVSHSTFSPGHDKLTFAYNHRDVSERNEIGPARGTPYGHAMLDEGPGVQKLIAQVEQEWRADPSKQPKSTNNWMLGQYIDMNSAYYKQGLERFGVSFATHWQDWMYHSFFRLYHSRNYNHLSDPLYASVASGFSFYTLNSLDNFQPNLTDGGLRRPLYWSFYAKRPDGRAGQQYAGDVSGVGPGNIFSVDKIQVIYPTIGDGNRGSRCFRPESLAKEEYFDPAKGTIDDKIGTQAFWGFKRDLNRRLLEQGIDNAHNYVREVRVAYWKKRVSCHCTVCSRKFYGCSVLNTGDHPDDNFYGTTPLENSDPTLKPGGSYAVSAGTVKFTPIAKAVTGDATIAPAIATAGDLGVSVQRIADPQWRTSREAPAGRPSLSKSASDQLQKVAGPSQKNARKLAMEQYGGHAKDAEAAAPQSEGNGDKYEIGQKDDRGTPGAGGTTATESPIEGTSGPEDSPIDSAPPTPLSGTLGPATIPPPPFVFFCPTGSCALGKRTASLAKCENGTCQIPASSGGTKPKTCTGSSCSTSSSGQNCGASGCSSSGSCSSGGEGGGGGQQQQQQQGMLLGLILGLLLGQLLQGGGSGTGSSPTPSPSFPPFPTYSPRPSSSPKPTASTTPTPSPTATQTATAYPTNTPAATPTPGPTEVPSPTAPPIPTTPSTPSSDERSSTRSNGFFGSGGDSQKFGFLREEKTFSQRLSKQIISELANYSKNAELPYRTFQYRRWLETYMIDDTKYILTESYGKEFACIGKLCNYDLADDDAGIAAAKRKSTKSICIDRGVESSYVDCWEDQQGLIKLGRALLESSLPDRTRAEIIVRAMDQYEYQLEIAQPWETPACEGSSCRVRRLSKEVGTYNLTTAQEEILLNSLIMPPKKPKTAKPGETPPTAACGKPSTGQPKCDAKGGGCKSGSCGSGGGSGGSGSSGGSGGGCGGAGSGAQSGSGFGLGVIAGLLLSMLAGGGSGGSSSSSGGGGLPPTQFPTPNPTVRPSPTYRPTPTAQPTVTPQPTEVPSPTYPPLPEQTPGSPSATYSHRISGQRNRLTRPRSDTTPNQAANETFEKF